ncbi:MAG: CPBP family intramembrane metalloprotease [Deltaproteobacteria bacterium]|nr:CPBP family intramembrane metalloprotease [Deltaproteobacteria bacterium]
MDPSPTDSPLPEGPAAPAPSPPAPPRAGASLFFLVVLLLHAVAGGAAQAVALLPGLLWSQLFAFLLPGFAAAAGANLDPRRFLLLRRPPVPAQLWLGALAGLAAFATAAPLAGLWSLLLPDAWLRSFDLAPLFQGGLAERAALVVLTSLAAPVCEEVAFRGYLLSALRLRLRDGAALWVGTLLFAAMHLDPVRLPALLVQGAVFAWLALRSGSLWPAVAAHAANNLAASLLAAADLEAGPASRPEPLPALALLLFGCAALAAVAAAWRRATPAPPPAEERLAPLDPARPYLRFSLDHLPPRYLGAVALGFAALAALAGWGTLRR